MIRRLTSRVELHTRITVCGNVQVILHDIETGERAGPTYYRSEAELQESINATLARLRLQREGYGR